MLAGPQASGRAQAIGYHLLELDRNGGRPPDAQLSFLQENAGNVAKVPVPKHSCACQMLKVLVGPNASGSS